MSGAAPSPPRIGEFDLIRRYFAPLATAPGAFALSDDAALFETPEGEAGVVTTDAMVAGVHFFESDSAKHVGWKVLAVNLSDLAAMGAAPIGYTLDLAIPESWNGEAVESWVHDFAAGLKECQERFALSLLGGDTVSTPGPLTLALTAFGSAPRDAILRRHGARAGDAVWVSGTIGDAALAVRLRKGWSVPAGLSVSGLHTRLDRPEPRLALGRALRGVATAAADVSDGLLADLTHICEASGVGAGVRIDTVPLSAEVEALLATDADLIATILTGGDDYELIFTAPDDADAAVRAAAESAGCPVRRIGAIVAGQDVRAVDAKGRTLTLARLGFTHF